MSPLPYPLGSPGYQPKTYTVEVHQFPSPTPGACAYERGNPRANGALIFIPGMTAGPHSTNLWHLDLGLGSSKVVNYALWEFRMRSSYTGWGYSSLKDDVADIAALVKYLRGKGKEKIVLMGHSTGCQGCLAYAIAYFDSTRGDTKSRYVDGGMEVPEVDGYVLLGPVSDREYGKATWGEEFDKGAREAADMVARGEGGEVLKSKFLPDFFHASPVTAYRWRSLSAEGGDDDFFSSDLSNGKLRSIFEKIRHPIMFLPCGMDELVPPTIDRPELLKRWIRFCDRGLVYGGSNFVAGADHGVSSDYTCRGVGDKVIAFLEAIHRGEMSSTGPGSMTPPGVD